MIDVAVREKHVVNSQFVLGGGVHPTLGLVVACVYDCRNTILLAAERYWFIANGVTGRDATRTASLSMRIAGLVVEEA